MKRKELVIPFIFLLIVLALRLPSIFEPYWYGDEGITLTVGQGLSRGLVLYKDIADNKTPLLYFLTSFFNYLPLLRGVLLIWVLFSTTIIYVLAKLILNTKAAIIATITYIIFTSLPVLEGNIANGEIFFHLPNILAILIAWYGFLKQKPKFYFWSGLFFGWGFLFKVPAVFDFIAVLFFLTIYTLPRFKELVKNIGFSLLGFVVPNALVFGYFLWHQAVFDYMEYGFRWNFKYASWGNDLLIPYGQVLLKGIPILAIFFFLFLLRRRLKPVLTLIILWLVMSFLGSILSARHYIHYFLQVVPALSLLIGMFFQHKQRFFYGLVLFLIFLSAFSHTYYLRYPILYYQNFLGRALGLKETSSYNSFFDPHVNRTYKVADFLRQEKEGPIFVWGDEPLIYALSRRSPVGRFSAAYNISWQESRKKETLEKLQKTPPVFIFVVKPVFFPFSELDSLISKNYQFVTQIEDVFVYAKKT
ncbi:glycosyltransferase family 39 protein [Candidatus Gottesmanbacteria bacterium]|nr:glycosyltransferase family 39 protein [Candidatus Gottesmanbacteria bacterium]